MSGVCYTPRSPNRYDSIASRAVSCQSGPRLGPVEGKIRTEIASIKGILGFGVKRLEAGEPLEAGGLGLVVVLVEVSLPRPVPEKVWNLDEFSCHGFCRQRMGMCTDSISQTGEGEWEQRQGTRPYLIDTRRRAR